MFYALLLIATASRLLPHPPNLVCIGALGLFAGCYLQGRTAWIVPVVAMLISDVVGHVFGLPGMGFYNPVTMAMVYAGFAITALIGRRLKDHRCVTRIGSAAVASSVVFFLLSNLGVWMAGRYDISVAGLIQCYTMAVPFYANTLAGDLFYSGLLFGTFELSRHGVPRVLRFPAAATSPR